MKDIYHELKDIKCCSRTIELIVRKYVLADTLYSQKMRYKTKFYNKKPNFLKVNDYRDSDKSKCVGKQIRLPNHGKYRQIEIKIENKNFKNVYPPNETVS